MNLWWWQDVSEKKLNLAKSCGSGVVLADGRVAKRLREIALGFEVVVDATGFPSRKSIEFVESDGTFLIFGGLRDSMIAIDPYEVFQ